MRVVGVDIGGTFTDFMLYDTESGAVHVHKVRSTPDDPGRALVAGLGEICGQAGVEPADVGGVFHGTTVATNAVLEHRGAECGLVTTEGFRDVVHIGRHQRPQHYSIMQDIPWQARPFVKRRHRMVVRERVVPPAGEVLEELDEEGVRTAARALRDGGRRVGRRLLPVLVPQPRARAPGCGDRPRGASRRLRDRERRRLPAVPGVRALHDRLHERVRRAGNGPLPRTSRPGARRRGCRRQPARDDVQRRSCQCRSGGREAGDAASLGPGRGRSRRSLGGRSRRARPPDHVRHGRHLGRHRDRHRARRRRSLGARHAGRRVPAARSDDRRAYDRCRRRLDRLRGRGRCVPRRAPERRSPPGPRVLRPRRRRADDHRCQRRTRPDRPGVLSRRGDAARPRSCRQRGRRARCPTGARPARDGRRHRDDRQCEHGPRGPLANRSEGPRSPGVRARGVRWCRAAPRV